MRTDYPKGCIPHELRCKHRDGIGFYRPWFCESCTADDAYNTYHTLNMAYRAGNPLVDDYRFDKFERFCRERWPEDKRFHQVGDTK